MQNSIRNLWIALVVVGIIAIGGYFFPKVLSNFGASTPGTRYPHGITIGNAANSPTNIADVKVGSCALIVGTQNIAVVATTTTVADCAVTGVVSTDLVTNGIFSTTTLSNPLWGSTSSSWTIVKAAASSTSGFITFTILNQTGGSATLSSSGIASSTTYTVVKTQ